MDQPLSYYKITNGFLRHKLKKQAEEIVELKNELKKWDTKKSNTLTK